MKKTRGFTLVELMTVVAIVGILAAIAIPGYNSQLRKSRRADAMRGLGDLVLRQENYRSSHTTYGTCAQILGSSANCTSYNSATASPFYTFAVTASSNTATGYVMTATPKAGTSQASDVCGTFTFTMASGVLTKTATGGSTCL